MPDTPQSVFQRADSSVVAAAYGRLGPINNIGDVLDQRNATDPAVTVASEQIGHLLDAFRYFSAALVAYLSNSRGNSVHFGYYSELRSALSLFAGSGVSVRLGKNRLIESTGAFKKFDTGNNRTHPLTWSLWSEWIKTKDASDILYDGISLISGLSLRDFSALPDLSGVLYDSWGYDFFQISGQDHTARNKASYNTFPDRPLEQMGKAHTYFVSDIWSLLLRQGGGVAFDASLIRFFIEKLSARYRTDGRIAVYRRKLYRDVSNQTGIPADTVETLISQAVEPKLFELAAKQDSDPEHVLSRAFFLLRIATLSVQLHARRGGKQAINAWLSNWLESLGLFDPSDVSIEDVEEDFVLAKESIDLVNGPLPAALWDATQAGSTVRLTRAEGFVAWGLVA